mmetsp:Transcript_56182/g.128978  ORF Transcript_56182/g.128978 Transcript_56182/m.128978 type:complete len:171 (-) Transcript_56182:267-779(-)
MSRDVDFLRRVGTMDYSFLVGVHYPEHELHDNEQPLASTPERAAAAGGALSESAASSNGGAAGDTPEPHKASGGPEWRRAPWVDVVDGGVVADGTWCAARGMCVRGGLPGQPRPVYYFGIIDILTAWSIPKQTESILRQISHPIKRKGVSCMPPAEYADRFEHAFRGWIQ